MSNEKPVKQILQATPLIKGPSGRLRARCRGHIFGLTYDSPVDVEPAELLKIAEKRRVISSPLRAAAPCDPCQRKAGTKINEYTEMIHQ